MRHLRQQQAGSLWWLAMVPAPTYTDYCHEQISDTTGLLLHWRKMAEEREETDLRIISVPEN